ncbi:MAG TPA: flagellar basal body-associated protein FliL [Bacillus sp. (in: firmicutes)]|uniref:flagellar basal body-associated protein FliL n=1 Tax=Bacillus litorisediminis TaxID=2922713 RepID=UPI001FACE737|nr:flagellar basal body-associated protein FliL [Bacillus litorisediminis]HWO77963.1 flagellar basal body-associated protein FliL [Bacillus sp. (in: firmicutes)]
MNNKLLTTLFALLLAIVLVGAGALLVLLKFDREGEASTPATIDEVLEASVDIPEITTNLLSGDFIRIAFKIQTDSTDTREELEKRSFQVNNLIIKKLSNMEASDFQGSQGKTDLENSLKSEINDLLTNGEIVQVYITSSVLQ